ncbi:MAG: hypothetical protein LBI41_00810 [Lactobacillales bacterium]|jgi:hypothetical protein|nr:hypothetical protein [Lactobacillales bacterium]
MKKLIKYYILFFLLAFFSIPSVLAESEKQKEVTLSVNDKSENEGTIYLAKDFTYALKKIQSGKFETEDFNTANLNKIHLLNKEIVVNKKNQTFILLDDAAKKITFGSNIKLNYDQAEKILKVLFLTQEDYLNILNDNKDKVDRELSLKIDHSAKTPVPKDHCYLVINKAKTKLPKIIYIKSKDNRVTFKKVKNNLQFQIKSFSMAGNVNNRKVVKNIYSVNYGETINYKLKVKIPKHSKKTTIELFPSHNLVIDNSTIKVEGLEESMFNIKQKSKFSEKSPYNSGSLTTIASISDLANWLKADNSSLEKYEINFIKNFDKERKTEFSFSARLHNCYDYDVMIKNLNSNVLDKATVSSKCVPDSGYYIEAKSTFEINKNEIKKFEKKSPNVQSFGSNFFLYDGFKSTPIQGAKFALFRVNKDHNVEYVQSLDKHQDYIWQKMDYQIKNIPENTRIEGKFYQGFVKNFDAKKIIPYSFKNSEENGIFYFRGLSTDYTYFLYQTEYAKNYQNSKKLWTFNVSNTSLVNAPQKYMGVSEYWPRKESYEEFNCIYNLKNGEELKQTYSGNHVKRYLLIILVVSIVFISLLIFIVLKYT